MTQEKSQGIYITQEDIDNALQPARFDADDAKPLFLDEADIVDSGMTDDPEGEEYFGLLSKDDIEALLHGDLEGSSGREAQDEIDNLFQTAQTPKDTPGAAEEVRSKNATQEDVERLFQEASEDFDAAGVSASAETSKGIETQASETDGAVSQDDIDRLLMEALDEGEDESEAAGGADSGGVGELLSQADLDRLLSGTSEDEEEDVEPEFSESASIEPEPEISNDMGSIEPEVAPEAHDGAESLISQSDLDQLLGGGQTGGDMTVSSPEPRSKSDHISQDDINRLLKESLEETEALPDEEADAVGESASPEPVILVAEEEPPLAPVPVEDSKPPEKIRKKVKYVRRKKRIVENRLVWAVAAGILLLVSITAMLMSSGPSETVLRPKVMTFSLSQTGDDSTGAMVLHDTRIRLPGFVVLAPPDSPGFTYLAADLTLDFSDAAMVSAIKGNEAFVRDIIYGTISSELMTRDISAIDEISLELAIRKALGRIVAREAIGRVSFDRFSLV